MSRYIASALIEIWGADGANKLEDLRDAGILLGGKPTPPQPGHTVLTFADGTVLDFDWMNRTVESVDAVNSRA